MREFFECAGLWSVVELPANFDWAAATVNQRNKNSSAVTYLRSALSPSLAAIVDSIVHVNVMWARLTQVQLHGAVWG